MRWTSTRSRGRRRAPVPARGERPPERMDLPDTLAAAALRHRAVLCSRPTAIIRQPGIVRYAVDIARRAGSASRCATRSRWPRFARCSSGTADAAALRIRLVRHRRVGSLHQEYRVRRLSPSSFWHCRGLAARIRRSRASPQPAYSADSAAVVAVIAGCSIVRAATRRRCAPRFDEAAVLSASSVRGSTPSRPTASATGSTGWPRAGDLLLDERLGPSKSGRRQPRGVWVYYEFT
jgi:hypothetical protein